jgi:mRNA-degrading endonuclease HigB of HigAB toxin-antitoxin module
MQLTGVKALDKFTRNNATLKKAVDEFIQKVLAADWENDADVKVTFPDADRIFTEVYIFNLTRSDRTLAMVYFSEGELEIVWVGNHQDYERKLKNNKNTIRKFLRDQGYDL